MSSSSLTRQAKTWPGNCHGTFTQDVFVENRFPAFYDYLHCRIHIGLESHLLVLEMTGMQSLRTLAFPPSIPSDIRDSSFLYQSMTRVTNHRLAKGLEKEVC